MSADSADFDLAIESLLEGWEPKLGRPTCGAGCSNCCRGTSVQASSGEVIRLLRFLDELQPARLRRLRAEWQRRTGQILADLSRDAGADPVGTIIGAGPCVFLDGDRCGVYAARPDTCRSFYVWHDSSFCGHPQYEMCLPAELSELRTKRLFETLREECDHGSVPFFGHLLVMVDLLDRRREEYLRGEDLRRYIEPVWLELKLISFVAEGRTRPDIEAALRVCEETLAQVYAKELWPLGHPRADNAANRGSLAPFSLNSDWRQPES